VNGVAGILLASVAGLPGISLGGSYLITTIAAVVLGGTPLGGGLGSVLATAGGALFITQLNASAATLQASTAVQMILQGIVIAMAVALYGAARRQRLKRARTSATPPSEGRPEALADRRRPARLPIRTERV
jgi:ribose transport system permease protein